MVNSATNHRKIILTAEQAVEIYKSKPSASSLTGISKTHRTRTSPSRTLAAEYGVSSKTIRDIWNRKTWGASTLHVFERQEKSEQITVSHDKSDEVSA